MHPSVHKGAADSQQHTCSECHQVMLLRVESLGQGLPPLPPPLLLLSLSTSCIQADATIMYT
jgi:hypothetical protein